ncbi:MAG: tyrosine--tRNA ligase [Patescibacteria group bacterium]
MKVSTDKQLINQLLTRGTEEVLVKKHLEKRLLSGERLRIKWGIDPTGSLMHLGHAVILKKLKEFQGLGHQVIFLIGDFTARIGDPSGRYSDRKLLTDKEIENNMKSYTEQAAKILNMKTIEVRYNSEWLVKLDFKELINLTSKVTYAQVSHRAEFKRRLKNDMDLTLQEFLYPVMQGYDSVALKADVEIGGTDQKFNLLMGRQLQKRYKQEEQDIIMCPILEGLDGKEKMSKSLDNYIGLTEAPDEMYGKVMTLDDAMIGRYFELCTDVSIIDIKKMEQELGPRDYKAKLAYEIVKLYNNEEAAKKAEAEFIRVFKEKDQPTEIPEIKVEKNKWQKLDLLMELKLVQSKSEAKRVIEQGGFRVNDQKITDWKLELELNNGDVLQVGKRKFIKILCDKI